MMMSLMKRCKYILRRDNSVEIAFVSILKVLYSKMKEYTCHSASRSKLLPFRVEFFFPKSLIASMKSHKFSSL